MEGLSVDGVVCLSMEGLPFYGESSSEQKVFIEMELLLRMGGLALYEGSVLVYRVCPWMGMSESLWRVSHFMGSLLLDRGSSLGWGFCFQMEVLSLHGGSGPLWGIMLRMEGLALYEGFISGFRFFLSGQEAQLWDGSQTITSLKETPSTSLELADIKGSAHRSKTPRYSSLQCLGKGYTHWILMVTHVYTYSTK